MPNGKGSHNLDDYLQMNGHADKTESIKDCALRALVYAQEAFRTLRSHWFNHAMKDKGQERVWEDVEEEKIRVEWNKEMRKRFDEQTEAILRGGDQPYAPTCSMDMDRERTGR